MGDRGNIKIKEATGNSIYLYGHWMGYEMPRSLQQALRFGEGRWNDESYLTRCIITEICKAERGNTGFGVSTYPTDNEYDILEVDSETQKVRLLDKTGWHDEARDWEKAKRKVKAEWSFEQYCALPMAEDNPWSALKGESVAA